MVVARKWVLKHRFVGEPKDEDLVLEEEELPSLQQGGQSVLGDVVDWDFL